MDDLPAVAAFCSAFPTDGRPLGFWTERLRHWWQLNPAVTAGQCLGTRLMAKDRIVGCSLIIPMRAHLHGKPESIVTRSTWRVLPEFRAQSLATDHANNKRFFDQLNVASTAIDSTRPLLKLWGWTAQRESIPTTVIPAHPAAVVCRLLRRTLKVKPLPKLVSNADEATTFAAADALWCATSQACVCGPVRDAAYYRWYAHDNPSMPFTVFAQVEKDPAQSLFALATHYDDGALQVMDLWPWNAPFPAMKNFLRVVVRTARQHRFHTLRVPHLSPAIATACEGWFASRTKQDAEQLLLHWPADEVADEEQCWPLNSGDVGI